MRSVAFARCALILPRTAGGDVRESRMV